MKKLILALLVLCLTIGTLVACADNTGDTESATETATETVAETATETVAETVTETATETATETTPESEPTVESTIESATATEPTTDMETETETETESATEPESEATPANAYLFTVLYDDTKKPAEGMQVQLCRGDDFCMMPKQTDAEGKVTYSLASYGYGEYEVHILNIPEGYTLAETTTSADVTAYTLRLLKKDCEHTYENEVCTKCGATQLHTHTVKVVYSENIADTAQAGKPLEGVSLLITTETSMVAQGTTDAEGVFTFEAPLYIDPETGVRGYSVVINSELPRGYSAPTESYLIAEEFSGTVALVESNTAFSPEIVSTSATIHCLLPAARTGSDVNKKYYYAIQPGKPDDVGRYRISIENAPAGVTLNIGHYASSVAFVASNPRTSDSGEAPAIEILLQKQYMTDSDGNWTYPNYWLIGIYVEGDADYPVEFELKVEKLRDLIPGVDYAITERERVQMAEGCKPADEITGSVSGELSYLATNVNLLQDVTLVKDENGYYHVGTVDGPFAMLNITKPNRVFGDGDDASFLNVNEVSGVENLLVSRSETRDGLSYNHVDYYADMFVQYSELCNADGAYPINQQLYDFLYAWVNQRASILVKGDLDEEHAPLVACSYYAEADADS